MSRGSPVGSPGSDRGVIEPSLPLDMPRGENPAPRPASVKRARRVALPVADLFGGAPEPTPVAATEGEKPARNARKRRSPEPAIPDASPETPEPAAPAVETHPPEPPAPEPVRASLLPDEILLQRVDPRSFRPNERPDSWLYWLTDRDGAQDALRDGLPIEAGETLLLSDRPAVLPQLAALAEDPDFSPAGIAVLRLKRIAVEPFLRPGPHPAFFLLAAEAD